MKKFNINENNRKTIISIGIFLAAAIFFGSYYFFAFAEGDSLENRLKVTGSVINELTDGTADFNDTTDTNGNDSSGKNNVVRTFDSVTYQVNYNLELKEEEEIPDPATPSGDTATATGGDEPVQNPDPTPSTEVTADDRTIIVDVVYPKSITGSVSALGFAQDSYVVFGDYKYAEFEVIGNLGLNSFNFMINEIYGANGATFTPEVYIKESTDSSKKSISELTDEQKTQSIDSIRSLLSDKNTCANIVGEGTDEHSDCSARITGRESYAIKVFSGSQTSDALETKFGVGTAIIMEPNDNESIGIKGLMYPTNVSFDVELSESVANDIYYDAEGANSIRSYKHDPANIGYSVYMDQNYQHPLPDTYDETLGKYNGTPSASYSNNKVSITISDIEYNKKIDVLNGKNVYFLSTNSFALRSVRKSYTENTEEIVITITAKQNGEQKDQATITDKLGRWVGIYKSKIDFYDGGETPNDEPKEDGLAILNYNQEFYIKQNLHYGVDGGNGLNSLTAYMKLDNDAIRLIQDPNEGNMEYKIRLNQTAATINANVTPKFYYGTWDLDHVKMKDNAPSTCPDITTLNKEQLMNLYGGPCIELKNVQVDTRYIDTYVVNELVYGPMAVELTFTPNEGEELTAGAIWSVWYKARLLDTASVDRSVRQVTTNATGLFKKDDQNTNVFYYLSDTINKSDPEKMINKDNYVKTNYNFVNREITSTHSTTCSGTTFSNCSVTGNSLLVSALRVTKPTISTYLTNMPSRETTEFYYYPIQWRIKADAYKNTNITSVKFNNAYLKVYIPAYLQKIDFGQSDDEYTYTVTDTTIGGEAYKVYSYTFDLKTSSSQAIDISLYTNIYLNTPNNSTPTVYAEVDYDVINGNSISNAVSPLSQRKAEKTVTIHNQSDINTQGTTTPAYIEKDGSYTFKMEAYNNSTEYSFANTGIYYVLPYKGDSSYEDMSSDFKSTGYKVKINNLPSGYTAYYTDGQSNTIIGEEIYINNPKTHEWVEWNTPTTEKTGITAIKIVKSGSFAQGNYFGGNDGITVTVTPIKSDYGDIYYNTFYVISDRPTGFSCTSQDENDPTCANAANTRLFYNSNRSSTSVYNRQISGFVWEDYDYSALFDNEESKMQDIPVSVCKVSDEALQAENYNPRDPLTYVKETDECNQDSLTDVTGAYVIRGLSEGSYYVKFTFDNQKYLVTDPYKNVIIEEGTSDSINSKAFQLSGTNIAVSGVVEFSNDEKIYRNDYINLGLKIKKQFEVNINKFITKTELTIDGNTTTKEYKNASKVSLSLKNTSGAHVRVKYDFVIENTKYFPGYVGLITDYMPTGMTFNSNIKENQDWIQYGNVLYYRGLSNRLLIPGQKYYFSLVLDMDIKKGGTYVNLVSATNLVLMGEEVPAYDFNNLTGSNTNTNTNNNTNTNSGNTNTGSSSSTGTNTNTGTSTGTEGN